MPLVPEEKFLDLVRSRFLPDNAEVHDLRLSGEDLSDLAMQGCVFRDGLFEGCSFERADLRGARFLGCRLTGTSFDQANLRDGWIDQSKLSLCTFRGAALDGGSFKNLDLTGSDFSGANMGGADLSGSKLAEAKLPNIHSTGARMIGTDFSLADLSGADLTNADLSGADFLRANLTGVSFRDAGLNGAHFQGAEMRDADLTGSLCTEADFAGARFQELDDAKVTEMSRIAESIMRASHSALTGESAQGRAPVNYDLLDASRSEIPPEDLRPPSAAAAQPTLKRSRTAPAILVLAVAAAVLVAVLFTLFRETPEVFEGDEFLGWIQTDGSKIRVRVDMEIKDEGKFFRYRGIIRPREASALPELKDALDVPTQPFVIEGSSQLENMAKLAVMDPRDTTKRTDLVLNCEIRVSTDLDWEQMTGFFSRDGLRFGAFKFRRPRVGELILRK